MQVTVPTLAADVGAHVSDELLVLLERVFPDRMPDLPALEKPIHAAHTAGLVSAVRYLRSAKRAYDEAVKAKGGALRPR